MSPESERASARAATSTTAWLHTVTQTLVKKKGQLQRAIGALGPYTRILSNIIGTGPWFDAYAVNLGTIATENSPQVGG